MHKTFFIFSFNSPIWEHFVTLCVKYKILLFANLLNVVHDSFMSSLDWRLPGQNHIALGGLCHHYISGLSRNNTH